MELAGENVMVAVFGMGEDAAAAGERLLAGLREAVEAARREPATAGRCRSRPRRRGASS